MILEGLRIPFKAIDITKPGMEVSHILFILFNIIVIKEERAFMKEKAHNRRCSKTVLPPQFFVDDDYVGVSPLSHLPAYDLLVIHSFI